jgi:hypothetical protein
LTALEPLQHCAVLELNVAKVAFDLQNCNNFLV